MNILVCIKPDMAGQEIGPFEALALEAGLSMKDALPAGGGQAIRVDVVTLGPLGWEDILRRALGMGADKAYHILTGDAGLVPTFVTAGLLNRLVSDPGLTPEYDLILTGVMSQDLMAGETGPMVAELLDCALVTAGVRLGYGEGGLEVLREWEGGVREELEVPFPALVSIQAGEYTPRYPKLSAVLRAKTSPIETVTEESLGRGELSPREIYLDRQVPERTRAGLLVPGSVQDQVQTFKTFLKERALI